MTIYDISHSEESHESASSEPELPFSSSPRERLFSSIATRVFFSLLFIADGFWVVFLFIKLFLLLPLSLITWGRSEKIQHHLSQSFISLRRAFVCGISLFIAFFSPTLGIMVACIYFLMHDKAGIDEVVPGSLKDQFQDFLKDLK
ncbi:hypothetical protein RSOCI_04665 [Rhabdochlamydiaceae symbiont of Dictyostelium giganteum]